MVRDSRLAEDLSQDVFARAFAALDGFRGEASPRTWLLKIARNRCLDHLDHLEAHAVGRARARARRAASPTTRRRSICCRAARTPSAPWRSSPRGSERSSSFTSATASATRSSPTRSVSGKARCACGSPAPSPGCAAPWTPISASMSRPPSRTARWPPRRPRAARARGYLFARSRRTCAPPTFPALRDDLPPSLLESTRRPGGCARLACAPFTLSRRPYGRSRRKLLR